MQVKVENGSGEAGAVRTNGKAITTIGWGLHFAFFGRKVEERGEGEAQGNDAAPVSERGRP